MDYLYEQINVTRSKIQSYTSFSPSVGIVLGSGLNELAEAVTTPTVIPYRDIPGFVTPAVAGHRGELLLGMLADQPVAILRGRFHFYEGHSMQQVTFPIRVLHALGCHTLIVTNAAGGLHSDWQVGDIMRITDQIFLPGMAGHHPLRGQHDERMGARFPAMLHPYDAEIGHLAHAVAEEQGVTLRQGVYAMLSGPSFESAAELRMLRQWGADAVGMSTAPEVIVARQAAMRVLGLSLVSNLALPDGAPADHTDVIQAGAAAQPTFAALLTGIVERLP